MQKRIHQIIQSLEQCSPYPDSLHQELFRKLYGSSHDVENSFYYFIFCIDWRSLFDKGFRITIYDILSNRGIKQFLKAYNAMKELLLQGDITNISKKYDSILNGIVNGLEQFQVPDEDRKKGLYEFFKMFISKVGGSEYSKSDYTKSDFSKETIPQLFIKNVYGRFMKAYQYAEIFNSNIRKSLCFSNVIISPTFCLHTLLRHYPPLKIEFIAHENPLCKKEIRDFKDRSIGVTAFTNEKGGTYIIGKDGVFQSTICTGNKNYLINDIDNIIRILKDALPILITRINPNISPNVIYLNEGLYGIEFRKYLYKQKQEIVVDSFYPLNSKWQKTFGISRKDYNSIINKDDMKKAKYSVRIEKPFITKCRLLYWTIQYNIFKLRQKR